MTTDTDTSLLHTHAARLCYVYWRSFFM